MTLPGECVKATRTACYECGTELTIDVCVSVAGYYLGFFCPNCGPYSRESGYFPTREAAQEALTSGCYGR